MDYWDSLYSTLGIKNFIYFISSPALQDYLFPVKLVFVTAGMFFFACVIYFMVNSSWLRYRFMEDTTEFFVWKSYGERQTSKQWAKIKKRAESGLESDYKLAIIDADDFLAEVLDKRGYDSENFENALQKASRLIPDVYDEVSRAHEMRNMIVYNPDMKVTAEQANQVLGAYEKAITGIGMS